VQIGEPVLQLVGLLGPGNLNGISLEVRAGEIVGIAGVEGNGQRELAETIMGLRPASAGSVRLAGRDLARLPVREIRNAGMGFIPEDRHEQGLVLDMTIWENAVLGRHDDPPFCSRLGVLALGKIKELAERLVKLFDVRARGIGALASTLSGGNQQKLILARELDTDPILLVAAQPTRGLDVGAIEFVHRRLVAERDAGRGILLVSLESDEVRSLADRILVIYEGRIVGEFPPDASEEELGIAMTGGGRREVTA
jgi:simple sugar transport system ATP-binding protein